MAMVEVGNTEKAKVRESKHLVLNQAIENLVDVVGQAEYLLLKVRADAPPDEDKNENNEVYSLARVLSTAPERLDALGMRLREAISGLREELF